MPVLNTLRIFLRPFIVFLLSAPIVVLLLAVQTGPKVPAGESLSAEEMFRIEQLLLDSAPGSPGTPGLQELQLNIDELNLLVRYGLNLLNLSPSWAARLTLEADTLNSELSLELNSGLLPLHLNIGSTFIEANQQLKLSNVSVGYLQLPKGLTEMGLARFRKNLSQSTPAFNDIDQLREFVDTQSA